MTRMMYDSANSGDIPGVGAQLVAGYLDGRYAWTPADWARFPTLDHVTITISASNNAGDVLDCEAGDAVPGQCGTWIAMRKAAGLYRPTIYCSRDTIPAVRQGTGSFVLGQDYDIWTGDWTGQPHAVIAPGPGAEVPCAAVQWENTPGYDVTEVFDAGWPHRHAPAPPTPTPTRADALNALAVLTNYIRP